MRCNLSHPPPTRLQGFWVCKSFPVHCYILSAQRRARHRADDRCLINKCWESMCDPFWHGCTYRLMGCCHMSPLWDFYLCYFQGSAQSPSSFPCESVEPWLTLDPWLKWFALTGSATLFFFFFFCSIKYNHIVKKEKKKSKYLIKNKI